MGGRYTFSVRDRISQAFDIIGDIHGCLDETEILLKQLGYSIELKTLDGETRFVVTPPEGRKAFFVDDLVDRRPNSPDVLRLVMDTVEDDVAICVSGNHEIKLQKKLYGKNVKLTHGLAETMERLEKESPEFIERVKKFITSMISYFVLDDGKLVVAHAGMKDRSKVVGLELFDRLHCLARRLVRPTNTASQFATTGHPSIVAMPPLSTVIHLCLKLSG